jgi:predicted alpha/beta hydrolase
MLLRVGGKETFGGFSSCLLSSLERTRSEARIETKYGTVAGWRRSLQRQLSNGVIPSREYSYYLLSNWYRFSLCHYDET